MLQCSIRANYDIIQQGSVFEQIIKVWSKINLMSTGKEVCGWICKWVNPDWWTELTCHMFDDPRPLEVWISVSCVNATSSIEDPSVF